MSQNLWKTAVTARNHPTICESKVGELVPADQQQEDALLKACISDLLVSWFAYQNESLLAAQALVETIIAAHRNGWSVKTVNMELAFLSLQKQDVAGQQIAPQDNDMLLSFVAVGMLTCQEVYCSAYDGTARNTGVEGNTTLEGLSKFVQSTLQQYANGSTLATLLDQQDRAVETQKAASAEPPPPQMKYMQNLTRVVLQTIETLQQQKLCLDRENLVPNLRSSLSMLEARVPLPDDAPKKRVLKLTGLAENLGPDSDEMSYQKLLTSSGDLTPRQTRWLAVKLLLAFMGSTMGWAFSYQVFVDTALLAYLSGASVTLLYKSLEEHEFSQAGVLMRTAALESSQSDAVNAEAFCRWLSTAFATWALMGVPHVKAGDSSAVGWGWASATGDADGAIAAHRLSEIVSNSLQNINSAEKKDGSKLMQFNVDLHSGVDEDGLAELLASNRDAAIKRRIDGKFMVAKINDPTLMRSSSATTYMMQQLGLVRLAHDAVIELQQRQSST